MITQERPDQQENKEEHACPTHAGPDSVLPTGSMYSDEEVLVLGPWQQVRQRLLSPVARVLLGLGISADLLSYTSVGLGLGFCLLAPFHFELAFWLLVFSVVCDGLDGVEARLTKTNTTRGSFTDLTCDVAVVALVVAGLAWKGLIYPALAVLFTFCYTALALLLVLHRLLRVSSSGIVRPSRMVFFAAIALDVFFRIDLLNVLLLLYLTTLPLMIVSFWRLRKAL
jgi:phosphatidylglycerophosphate synthase